MFSHQLRYSLWKSGLVAWKWVSPSQGIYAWCTVSSLSLQDCTIILNGPMQALYLHRLTNCCVEAGPVHSATFGEELHNCQLSLASHQLRLHGSTSLQVYLRAGSDPIIEHCTAIGFGPLPGLGYEGFDELCHAADLHPPDRHWDCVQDFLNPGSQLKTNWYIIKRDDWTPWECWCMLKNFKQVCWHCFNTRMRSVPDSFVCHWLSWRVLP